MGGRIRRIRAEALRTASWALSPTWRIAHRDKAGLDRSGRSRLIRRRNALYLRISVLLAACAEASSLAGADLVHAPAAMPARLLLAWYLVSRCNEVFYAFYRDAFDKVVLRRRSRSSLSWARRLRLALNSYAEVVLDFALLYALLPHGSFDKEPNSFLDLLFYSANTITTSGGGGILPEGRLARLLTDYEVLCGLVLLAVCFAIYVGRAFADRDGRR